MRKVFAFHSSIYFCVFELLSSNVCMSSDIQFEIVGNNFTDTDAILSLLEDIPENIDKEKTYYSFPTKEDVVVFRRSGKKFF